MFSLWDGFSQKQKEEFCKNYLLHRGYHVWDPIISKQEVKTIPQLVRFFYDVMAVHRTDATIMYAVPNTTRDRAVLSNLVKSRVKLGMSKKRAIDEVCFFIEQLFECEESILLQPITSPGILSNEKMAWLPERIWRICEGYDAETNIEQESRWFDSLYKQQAENVTDEAVLEALKRMKRMTESDANNGKEEDRD